MKFALDFDGTYTMDPPLWDKFIEEARKSGHEVYIVTMRYKEFEKEPVLYFKLDEKCNGIVFCNRLAKIDEARRQLGFRFDIWIDDQPEWLFEDAIVKY